VIRIASLTYDICGPATLWEMLLYRETSTRIPGRILVTEKPNLGEPTPNTLCSWSDKQVRGERENLHAGGSQITEPQNPNALDIFLILAAEAALLIFGCSWVSKERRSAAMARFCSTLT
jgi:hypothetical protein